MSRFILKLLEMMRLRSGPQEMPAGWMHAAVLIAAYIAQGFYADQSLDEADNAPRSLLAITVQFSVITALLNFRNLSLRVPQTLAALAGKGFIFGILSLLILAQVVSGKSQQNLAYLYLGLFAWSLAVDAHIYRHALSIKMSIGVLLAVMIFAANFMLLKTVFG
jgi:hypothetical protein